MPYERLPITRATPGCIVFVLDQSSSMGGPFGGEASGTRKADGLADAINRLLQNLVVRCTKAQGVYDYFDVAVLGYNTARVGSAFSGHWAHQELVPVSAIEKNPLRVEERRVKEKGEVLGGLVEVTKKFPVWIEPTISGGTPMCQALNKARGVVEGWIVAHPDNFPPIVIHITDGESTDGDPLPAARQLTSLATSDGQVLLFNCHLSSHKSTPVLFPSTADGLPDQFARLLFEMSSVLPPGFQAEARNEGFGVAEDARGFGFNVDLVQLIRFIDIGSRVSLQLR